MYTKTPCPRAWEQGNCLIHGAEIAAWVKGAYVDVSCRGGSGGGYGGAPGFGGVVLGHRKGRNEKRRWRKEARRAEKVYSGGIGDCGGRIWEGTGRHLRSVKRWEAWRSSIEGLEGGTVCFHRKNYGVDHVLDARVIEHDWNAKWKSLKVVYNRPEWIEWTGRNVRNRGAAQYNSRNNEYTL